MSTAATLAVLAAAAGASAGPLSFKIFGLDPLLYVLAGVIVGIFFFLFLLFRRTVTGFKEGVDEARER